jgi:hypothetical protein
MDDSWLAANRRAQRSPQPPDPWQAFTPLDAFKPRPPLLQVVDGLITLPSLVITYGAPGLFKSMLLGDLCVCVAGGIDWLPPAPWQPGASPFKTRPVPVTWIDFDNGIDRTHERIAALVRGHQLDPEKTALTYYAMPRPWLQATELRHIGSLVERIQAQGSKLVVIDNLGAVRGSADENTSDMQRVMANFQLLKEETRAAVILIHHQRKMTGFPSREGDKLRGHSSIEQAIDLALVIDRDELSSTIAVKSTKTRGADVDPFRAAFSFEHRPDSRELYSALFYAVPAGDKKSEKAIDLAILEAVHGRQLNQSGLVALAREKLDGVGINRIRDRIDSLAGEQTLVCTNGPANNEKLYSEP